MLLLCRHFSLTFHSLTCSYDSKRITGCVGINNQGATCYMNSLLQALYMTPELRYALYSWRWTAGRDKPKEECIPYQLQLLFCRLQTVDSR